MGNSWDINGDTTSITQHDFNEFPNHIVVRWIPSGNQTWLAVKSIIQLLGLMIPEGISRKISRIIPIVVLLYPIIPLFDEIIGMVG
jgi:hypothetical protein